MQDKAPRDEVVIRQRAVGVESALVEGEGRVDILHYVTLAPGVALLRLLPHLVDRELAGLDPPAGACRAKIRSPGRESPASCLPRDYVGRRVLVVHVVQLGEAHGLGFLGYGQAELVRVVFAFVAGGGGHAGLNGLRPLVEASVRPGTRRRL